DQPEEMFGKVMSISDDLMWRYYELLSFRPMDEIEAWKAEVDGGANPRDIKVRLAEELVERFHSKEMAEKAHQAFIARFQKGQIPDEMPECELKADSGSYPIANLLKDGGLVKSTSEAMRMIKQGAVRIDGDRVEQTSLTIEAGTTGVFQVGKRRFARISVS
ncbi:MAG: S4 domain-containing protein, partial [Candidatus Thiodiazotropha taylori]